MVSQSYSTSSSTNLFPCSQESNTFKPPPPMPAPQFHSSLRSIRKPPTKVMKTPIAPLPPTPHKVYKVEASKFKQLVQELTAAPEFQSGRLENMAPPSLSLSTTDKPLSITPESADTCRDFMSEKVEIEAWKQLASLATTSPMGFSPSSMSHAWCSSEILDTQPWSHMWCNSFPLLSPGTLSALEKGM